MNLKSTKNPTVELTKDDADKGIYGDWEFVGYYDSSGNYYERAENKQNGVVRWFVMVDED